MLLHAHLSIVWNSELIKCSTFHLFYYGSREGCIYRISSLFYSRSMSFDTQTRRDNKVTPTIYRTDTRSPNIRLMSGSYLSCHGDSKTSDNIGLSLAEIVQQSPNRFFSNIDLDFVFNYQRLNICVSLQVNRQHTRYISSGYLQQ